MPQESSAAEPVPSPGVDLVREPDAQITSGPSAPRAQVIGVGLDARLALRFAQLRGAAREARQLGFESLWTPAGGVPDSFHVCAAWSQDTSLRNGIAVVPAARMWTPLGLAAQAATLAQ